MYYVNQFKIRKDWKLQRDISFDLHRKNYTHFGTSYKRLVKCTQIQCDSSIFLEWNGKFESINRRLVLPNYQCHGSNKEKNNLEWRVFGFHTRMFWQLVTLKPSESRTYEQRKSKKKSGYKPSNVGKIINMRKNSDSQVDSNHDQKCKQSSSLQEHNRLQSSVQ